jgi:hypothetical protein
MAYKCKHFAIHELVPKQMFLEIHEDALWKIFDDGLLMMLDKLKETFPHGSMSINDYFWNGKREWSGIRTKDSKYYSSGSMHSVGQAFDIVFSEYDVGSIRNYILLHQDEFEYITRMEDKVNWLHIDCKHTGKDEIILFNP